MDDFHVNRAYGSLLTLFDLIIIFLLRVDVKRKVFVLIEVISANKMRIDIFSFIGNILPSSLFFFEWSMIFLNYK